MRLYNYNMRILELNFEKTWRGGERQTLCNMTGFRSRGLQVELLCRKNTPLQEAAVREGFTVHAFDSVLQVISFLASKATTFDIMHAQTAQVLTYCALTKPFHRCKLVYTRRVNFILKGSLTRWKYLQTDALVAISRSVQKIVSDFTGRKNIALISSVAVPVDPNRERGLQLLRQLGIDNKKIIATTAALTAEKGPFVALEATRILLKKRNDIVFLHFGDGTLREEMKQKVKEAGMDQTYFLPGHVEGVEDLFAIMDVFLMSSYNEGLGSSVLDAFFQKVPVVSSNAGGLADLVADGRAIACEPGAAACMAEGISYLLDNPVQAATQCRLAYEYAVAHHSMESITNQYLQLFEQLQSSSKASAGS